MSDKYYRYETGKDFEEDARYLLDNITDEELANDPNLVDAYINSLNYIAEIETKISKAKIEKRRLNKKHEHELKRAGILGFIAGSAFVAALAFAKPQFVGGEKIANDAYQVIDDEGYGWRDDSQSGYIFNEGTEYVSYEEAMSDITADLRRAGFDDVQIDIALNKIFHKDPENSTLEERVNAKRAYYYEDKLESSKGL